MTTHQLATLLESLRSGMGAFIKVDTGKEFDEACSAFRELPDQPLKKLAELIRKPTGGNGATPRAVGGKAADVVERIKSIREGTVPIDGLYVQLDKLKNNELKDVLAAFGQKGTTTVAGNLDRVKALLTQTTNGTHAQPSHQPAVDEKQVNEGIQLYERLRDTRNLSIPDVRSGFEPMRGYPKPVIEEIVRRLKFTPHGSVKEMLDRLLANLEALKMTQYRSETILTGA